MKNSYSGSCHCQNIKYDFHSDLEFSEISPRACDCDFCLKHRASFVSDPKGKLRIQITDINEVNHYRHGSQTAEFIVCKKCGVFVTVTYTENGIMYAGINSNTVFGNSKFGKKHVVSPKTLRPEEKIPRWKAIWFSYANIK